MAEPLAARFATPQDLLAPSPMRLVEAVDRLLDRGVVIRGEIWLSVAEVDLVFLGVDLVLASPDTMKRGRG